MTNKLFLTASLMWMLLGVAFGATDGAEVDYGREWSPYVMTVRGGLLFGESKFSFDAEKVPFSSTVRSKNSGFGSGEFGFLLLVTLRFRNV